MRIIKLAGELAALILAAVVAGEALSQGVGIAEMPLYQANSRIGYLPQPNQRSRFLWTYDWSFNEKSMATSRPFKPSARTDVLLLGDSIVAGGSWLRGRDRLGPQIEQRLNATVWPVSAHGWSLQNELEYLAEHPEVVAGVDLITFVLSSDDFDIPTEWRSDVITPLSRPFPALWYAARRYVLTDRPAQSSPWPVKKDPDLAGTFAALGQRVKVPVIVYLYPHRGEKLSEKGCPEVPVSFRAAAEIQWRCVGADRRWNPSLYADDIHPTKDGTVTLAAILADDLGGRSYK